MENKNMESLFELVAYVLKSACFFFRNVFLRVKNRNKFFVADYKSQPEKEFYYSKKTASSAYGVFYSKSKEPLRIYKKPEHDNPKKLAKQYAKKLAWKKANGVN